jgi:hypothetical protein
MLMLKVVKICVVLMLMRGDHDWKTLRVDAESTAAYSLDTSLGETHNFLGNKAWVEFSI